MLLHLLLLLPSSLAQQVDFDENDILVENFTSSTTTTITPVTTVDFQKTIEDKLTQLDKDSEDLVIDFVRNGRKFNGDLRRRLVLYVMEFSPIQLHVEMNKDPEQQAIIDRIKYRFRSGMKIKYSSLKNRVDRLVAHLLAPIFTPFYFLQPDELRPMLPPSMTSSGRSNTFSEPVTEAPQAITNAASTFTALEMFPSNLPRGSWAQMDPRWMQQPAQLAATHFTPTASNPGVFTQQNPEVMRRLFTPHTSIYSNGVYYYNPPYYNQNYLPIRKPSRR